MMLLCEYFSAFGCLGDGEGEGEGVGMEYAEGTGDGVVSWGKLRDALEGERGKRFSR